VKSQKVSRIGIVVCANSLRASQWVEGRLVRAEVSFGSGGLTKSLRKLLSSSPFVGRDAVVGLEGPAVLVESLAVPPGASSAPTAVCAERLKGDPIFNAESAALGVAAAPAQGNSGPGMVVLAAVNKAAIAEVMAACRDVNLEVQAVEAAALASWRAVNGSGLQVRLLRGSEQDVVQAGVDGRLLFCRVVSSPMSMPELKATVTRAASLLGGRFERLLVCGPVDAELAAACRSLRLELEAPPEELEDPGSVGLATEGPILTEFTPPEERTRRVARRVRKVRFSMVSAAAALLMVSGVLGFQRLSNLRDKELALQTEIANRDDAQLELTELRGSLALVSERDERLAQAVPGHLTSNLWALLLNQAPMSVLLETVSIEDRLDTLRSPARNLTVKLSGLAADGEAVRTYADNLIDSRAFADVHVETSERVLLDGGTEGERFRITTMAETR